MLQAERLIKRKVTKGRRGSKPGSKNLTRSKRVGAKYKEQKHKNKQTADWKGRGKRRLTRLWWNQSAWDRPFLGGKPKRGTVTIQEVPNTGINYKFKTRAPETKKSTPRRKKKLLSLWHSYFQAGSRCRTFIWDTNTDSRENAIGTLPDYFLNEMIHQ